MQQNGIWLVLNACFCMWQLIKYEQWVQINHKHKHKHIIHSELYMCLEHIWMGYSSETTGIPDKEKKMLW